MFTNKKIEDIDTFVCAVSPYVAETPKASIKGQEPPLPIIPFGIVAYGFVGEPFSVYEWPINGIMMQRSQISRSPSHEYMIVLKLTYRIKALTQNN